MIAYRYNISYMAPVAIQQFPAPKPYRSGLYRDRRNCRRAMAMRADRMHLPVEAFDVVQEGGCFRFVQRYR